MQHRQFSSHNGKSLLVWDEMCVFLTQEEIQAAVEHLAACRINSAMSSSHHPSRLVPNGAINGCQESHKAASAQQSIDSNEGIYHLKGLMGAGCQHDNHCSSATSD